MLAWAPPVADAPMLAWAQRIADVQMLAWAQPVADVQMLVWGSPRCAQTWRRHGLSVPQMLDRPYQEPIMADILYDFPIAVEPDFVFDAISRPEGLDQWWTRRSAGEAATGAEYELWFGPAYDWRAVVTACERPARFELKMTVADADWTGTQVGFALTPYEGGTSVQFHHTGWPEANDHFRTSSFCWAMYLRILRRFLEFGERVAYDERLDV